jgi:predicted RNA binding protein YcfA (HicA-like mRNA interferase family)
MPKIPPMKPEELERLLIKIGFKFSRQKGSHKRYIRPDGRSTTVPSHKGKDIPPVLLRAICREINILPEDFIKNKCLLGNLS